jgi:addiction module HigA family antidote
MKTKEIKIPTPTIGQILKDEFLEPLHLSGYRLAKEINVSTSSIVDILNNKRRITVDMALRLSKFFGNTERFWLNLQNDIDLRNLREKLQYELEKIHTFKRSA